MSTPLLPPVTLGPEAQAEALRTRAGARLLDDRVVSVRGDDRQTWLNGMVTNDVRSLRPGGAVYAAAVNVKGRVLSDLFVLAREDELLVLLPARTAEALLAHLEQFVIMEDVTLALVPDARVLTVQGPGATSLGPLGESFPCDRLGRGGRDVVVTPSREDALRDALAPLVSQGAVVPVDDAGWELARLEAGVFRFGRDFDEGNIIQEAAITPRAVSFHKGCYLGQEVVCRVEMRGAPQKHLCALVFDASAPVPTVGAKVARASDGHEVGEVTSAARSPALDAPVAIAMVRRLAAEKEELVVGGAPARIVDRPVP